MPITQVCISRNLKIYEINYALSPESNALVIKEARKITEDGISSLNMTYDYHDEKTIVSQRIGKYFQLSSYEKNTKKVLTSSCYHKQDPSISPCGNFIAYVAQMDDGSQYIEVINKYSGDVIRVTPEPGEYRFPTWLVR
jgi:hypothetical protein